MIMSSGSNREWVHRLSGLECFYPVSLRNFTQVARVAHRGPRALPCAVVRQHPHGIEAQHPETVITNLFHLNPVVVDAGRAWLESRARQTYYVPQWLEKTDETRRLFARFIGAGQDEIGFLYATSEGENVVVNSLDWKAGDNVVVNDLVYPSTPVILRRLEQTQGVELRMANHREGATTIEDFARLVDDRTRLLSVALVSNISGYRHDMKALAELAHDHSAYLYADACRPWEWGL